MNPGYFRLKQNMEEAVQRLCDWLEKNYKEKIETYYSNVLDASLNENNQWKGSCVYVYENEGWTVFEDLMGAFSFIDAEEWKAFAKEDEFVFAAYNDAMLYAELIVITDGVVTKNFMENDDIPEDNINEGNGVADIENWTDVAAFMDDDDLVNSDKGTVYIFKRGGRACRKNFYAFRHRSTMANLCQAVDGAPFFVLLQFEFNCGR